MLMKIKLYKMNNLDKLLKEGVDLILLSISDITASERVINKIKEVQRSSNFL